MPKFNTKDSKYIVLFTSAVAITCSLILSFAATILNPLQVANVKLDKKKNVLKAFGVDLPPEEIPAYFEERVTGIVIDSEGQQVEMPEGETAIDLNLTDERKKPLEERWMPVFVLEDENGEPSAYAVSVIGKGLWSTLYAYLALEADLNTVAGIVFYQHGETPGLGGEIDQDWFLNNFKGKKILNEVGELVAVSVVKGSAAEKYSGNELSHYVDGISGATITCRGVSEMLIKDLKAYEPYLDKVRGED